MSPFPHSLGPDHSLAAAHRLMRRHKIRHLPILDQGMLIGIVSQRDLYFVQSFTQVDESEVKVTEAMEEKVDAVAPNTPLREVCKLMAERKSGSVIVMDGDKVIGIFTSVDALEVLADLAAEPVECQEASR